MPDLVSHHYPKRSRMIERGFAWFLARSEPQMNRIYAPAKTDLFAPLRGQVLEIGPGTGVNFPHYPPEMHLTGVEPNPFTYDRLRAHAASCGLSVTLLGGYAEELPVHDGSMDAVVSTLVLCSVFEPARVLQEVMRVLKSGGRFVFLEHVIAPEGSVSRRFQRALRTPWHYCGDGCYLDRETWKYIDRAGFSNVNYTFHNFNTPFFGLIRRHIAGYAVK